ncbi:hypothetical protein PIB30_065445 [Stylosanthes scabra]|uniref:Uncharacterized protein n=1 Tax=Stylosanthes scabra TaxID=79078 RepID=A0ABU6VQC6_9FABA|nr:hypothetical protein [Stylosanthes scabra]
MVMLPNSLATLTHRQTLTLSNHSLTAFSLSHGSRRALFTTGTLLLLTQSHIRRHWRSLLLSPAFPHRESSPLRHSLTPSPLSLTSAPSPSLSLSLRHSSSPSLCLATLTNIQIC